MDDDEWIFDLIEKFRKSFRRLYSDHPPRDERELYVTEVLYCPRKAFLNYTLNARFKPNVAMIEGTIHHMAVPDLDFWRGKDARFEVPVKYKVDDFVVSGRVDVVAMKPDQTWEVYEFKFPARLGNENVEPTYLMQGNAYAFMLDDYVGYSVTDVYVVEVAMDRFRDEIDVRVLYTKPNREMFDAFLKKARYLIECIKNQELPEGPEFEWECNKCPYNIICNKIKPSEPSAFDLTHGTVIDTNGGGDSV